MKIFHERLIEYLGKFEGELSYPPPHRGFVIDLIFVKDWLT